MKNLPVHWYEGLFLRPHHLQAMERHWAELFHTALHSDNPYNYGLFSFEYSEEALANQQFDVRKIQARMRDGTIIDMQAGQEPDRVSLKGAINEVLALKAQMGEAFAQESEIRVYLAVPKLKLGRNNTGKDRNAETRYSETRFVVDDENRGGFDQEVQFRDLNAKLLLSTQDLAGHELLPIAQVKRASDADATPILDDDYIPPVVSIGAWPGLSKKIVQPLYDVIGQKLESLSRQVVGGGIGRESQATGDADRIAMLEKLNEAYATMSVMAFAKGMHPLVVYTELCRILGQLSIFTPARRVPDIPAYDHEDLARIFKEVARGISDISPPKSEHERRFFQGAGLGMHVTLEPKWLHKGWEWYVGVERSDLSPEECSKLLTQANWKFGSAPQVDNIFLTGASGVKLQSKPLARAVRDLPASQRWLYYEVVQDNSDPWRDIERTLTLAMRLSENYIVNKGQLQGSKEMIVNAHGRQVALKFALFAIPPLQ